MPPLAPSRRLALIATAGAHMLILGHAMANAGMGSLVPAMATDLGFDKALARYPFFTFAASYLVGVGLLRLPQFQWSNRRLALVSALMHLAAMVAWALSRNLWWLSASFFATGMFAAWMEVAITAMCSRLYPKNVSGAITLLHASFGIGAWAGPFFMERWLDAGLPWWGVPLLICAFFALAAALFTWAKGLDAPAPPAPLPPKREAQGEGSNIAPHLSPTPPSTTAPPTPLSPKGEGQGEGSNIAPHLSPPFRTPWLLCTVALLYIGTEMTLGFWAPTALQARYALSDAKAAGLMGNFWLLMAVGRLLNSAASRLFSPETMLLAAGLLSTATHLCLVFAHSQPMGLWSLWLTGFFFSGAFALALSIAGNRQPHHLEKSAAAMVFFQGLGLLAGPPLAGLIAKATSLEFILRVSAGLNVGLALACVFVLLTRQRPAIHLTPNR